MADVQNNDEAKKKTPYRSVRKGQKCVTVWLENEFLEKVEDIAAEKGWPRTLLIENLLRKEMGMPELVEPKFGTNYHLLKEMAFRNAQSKKKPKK